MTDFTIYSIGIILLHRNQLDTFDQFVNDMITSGGIRVLRIGTENLTSITEVTQEFDLDFDDAYQYRIAKEFDLEIVSFDTDFDQTDVERRTPDELFR